MLLLGIFIGTIIGAIAAIMWRNTPTGQVAAPRFYRRRETGETYRDVGRADLAETYGDTGELRLLAASGKPGQEAWPEKRVREEFDEVSVP